LSKNFIDYYLARILLIKHEFKRDEHGVAGPKYWKTEEGKLLNDLNEQIRKRIGDRSKNKTNIIGE